MAALPPITPPSSFRSPYDYCASVANTDSPDAKKVTSGIEELTKTARDQAALFNGEVRWRCMEGAVWVCVQPAGSLSCDKVPSATDRVLICAAHPDTPGIRNAGAIFIGAYTPEAMGDYVAGSNHVLPTARSARFSSGLGVLDFMKRTSLLKCGPEQLRSLGPSAIALGQAEGLSAHARSVAIRLNQK
jgi:histidinol dehydrogenase